jgi:hypothetical protein
VRSAALAIERICSMVSNIIVSFAPESRGAADASHP